MLTSRTTFKVGIGFLILLIEVGISLSSFYTKEWSSSANSYLDEFPSHPSGFRHYRSDKHREIYTWPAATVFYEIGPEFNKSSREIIHGAMNEIADRTCIKFLPREESDDYVYIQMRPDLGCRTQVGKRGGKQFLTLDTSRCIQHGRVMHELMHALGFTHEHQRPDRDEYIEIIWDNIKRDEFSQFIKLERSLDFFMGLPYDYTSITHYANVSPTASIDTKKPIILPKKPTTTMGQRDRLSHYDVKKIGMLYRC